MLNDLFQSLNPIAFQIGPLTVRWYGLAYITAFIVGYFLIRLIVKRWRLNLSAEDLATLVLIIALGVVIGGRLGYVLFYGNGYFLLHPLEIMNLTQGGMSFHGGVIGAALAGFIGCKVMRVNFLTLADLVAIVAPVGLFLGRIANFINGELWGKPTDLPIGVAFPSGGGIMRHPSQLYEALLEGAVIFIVLFAIAMRTLKHQGFFLGLFLVLYGVFRILVEFVRVPDAQLGCLFGFVTMGMLLSVPLIILGVVLLVWQHMAKRPQRIYSGRDVITKL